MLHKKNVVFVCDRKIGCPLVGALSDRARMFTRRHFHSLFKSAAPFSAPARPCTINLAAAGG